MTGSRGEADTVAEFTDGDQQAAVLLRDNLTRLRDLLRQPDSPVSDPAAAEALRREVGEVLAGRRSMRSLATDPAFVAVAERGMRDVQDAWEELSPDERAAQVRTGRQRK
jgi:hypothetical protein